MANCADIPEYLSQMVRRKPPNRFVVRGTTPVISFGDASTAEVATLGINPSASEFLLDGVLLSDNRRRLATLESLHAISNDSLTDTQVKQVLDDCSTYFDRNPYWLWFRPLEKVIKQATGQSYADGTACHLDLVQWATDPVWGKLKDNSAKQQLLAETHPHLINQIKLGRLSVVLMNGRSVIDRATSSGLVALRQVDVLRVGSVSSRIYVGQLQSTTFIGWSTNMQSSFGVTRDFGPTLASWIERRLRSDRRS